MSPESPKLCRWFSHAVGSSAREPHCLHVLTLPCSLVPCSLANCSHHSAETFYTPATSLLTNPADTSPPLLYSPSDTIGHFLVLNVSPASASLTPLLHLPLYLSGLPRDSLWLLLFFSSVLKCWCCEGSGLRSHHFSLCTLFQGCFLYHSGSYNDGYLT